jgi:hypothetical protein
MGESLPPNSNNQNQQQIFSIENSTNRELGKQLRQEIDQLTKQFIELDDHENKILLSKKSIILELADKFERLQEIGEYPFPVHSICDGVLKHLKRNGYNIGKTYVYTIIKENAPQYINSDLDYRNSSYQIIQSKPIDIKTYQDIVSQSSDTLLNTKFDLLEDDQIRDLIEKHYSYIDRLQEYADQRNILLSTYQEQQQEEGSPHYDSKELDPFKDQITTDKPDPNEIPSTLAEATIQLGDTIEECGKMFKATGKMMMDYPPAPQDQELEINAVKRVYDWKEFWRGLILALKSGTDRKYRRSITQWMKIADDEESWGKHAASSKNPYLAKFRDPKTGEWKEEIRKLTREQIGDKAIRIREFQGFMKKVMPACLDFIRWSEIYMFPYASGLSTKLHEKLSDRSLR